MGQEHMVRVAPTADVMFSRGVHLLEDCAGTWLWTEGGTNGDDVHEYATAAAYFGTNGIHVKTRSTGASLGDTLTLLRYLGGNSSGRLVARAMMGLPDVSQDPIVWMELQIGDGSDLFYGAIKIDNNAQKAYYLTTGGTWVEVAAWSPWLLDGYWMQLEMILDCENGNYVSGIVNGVSQDLAGIPMKVSAGAGIRQSYLILGLENGSANLSEAYWDAVFVGEELVR